MPQLKPKQSAKSVSNEYVSETGIYQPTDNAKAIQQMVACGLSKNNDRHFDASKGNPGRMPPPLSKRAASSFLNHEKGTPSHPSPSSSNISTPIPAALDIQPPFLLSQFHDHLLYSNGVNPSRALSSTQVKQFPANHTSSPRTYISQQGGRRSKFF